MSETKKMQNYIEQENVDQYNEHDLLWPEVAELLELVEQSSTSALEAIALAFKYGKTKGYRAAKAEGRATA